MFYDDLEAWLKASPQRDALLTWNKLKQNWLVQLEDRNACVMHRATSPRLAWAVMDALKAVGVQTPSCALQASATS